MEETIDIPEITLETREQLFVLVIATVAGFAAEHFTKKGFTKLILSRK